MQGGMRDDQRQQWQDMRSPDGDASQPPRDAPGEMIQTYGPELQRRVGRAPAWWRGPGVWFGGLALLGVVLADTQHDSAQPLRSTV